MNLGDGESHTVEFSPGFPYQGSVLFSHVPAGFVLIPVVSPGEHGPALVPDDLLWVKKSDPEQPIQNLTSVDTGVPHVPDLKARHQLERFRPLGARVGGDGRRMER